MNIYKTSKCSKTAQKMIDKLEDLVNDDEKEVAVLKKGSGFGEGALLNDKPRAASIRCKTDCYFAILNRKDYAESIGQL